ncbi:MAG: hypothetical protein M3270_02125 [Thermoproteota archaeon]|nr:hypothetical protein [Thermoproteota archaeon]
MPESFAQTSVSSSPGALGSQESGNHLTELEAARQRYLSVWDNSPFSSKFDVFIAEGTHAGYGIYREHVPANVFRPGETIVLYVEPVGFGHQPIAETSGPVDGGNSTIVPRTLYLINMTADMIISDSTGNVLQTLENLPTESFISHTQNTEFSLTLTLSQEQPFPVGDYIISYILHDQVTGKSFQLDRRITIDDNAITGALPLPDSVVAMDNSSQQTTAEPVLQ